MAGESIELSAMNSAHAVSRVIVDIGELEAHDGGFQLQANWPLYKCKKGEYRIL